LCLRGWSCSPGWLRSRGCPLLPVFLVPGFILIGVLLLIILFVVLFYGTSSSAVHRSCLLSALVLVPERSNLLDLRVFLPVALEDQLPLRHLLLPGAASGGASLIRFGTRCRIFLLLPPQLRLRPFLTRLDSFRVFPPFRPLLLLRPCSTRSAFLWVFPSFLPLLPLRPGTTRLLPRHIFPFLPAFLPDAPPVQLGHLWPLSSH
jgi:hypothetical protein